MRKNLSALVELLPVSNSEYEHIQYSGCANLTFESPIGSLLANGYPGLFNRGFSENSVPTELWHEEHRAKLFMPCMHNSSLWQPRALDDSSSRTLTTSLNLERHGSEYLNLLLGYKMDASQVERWLVGAGEFWPKLVNAWRTTRISDMYLSSVGIAIGHANWSRTIGDNTPLSVWISDLEAR